MKTRNPHTSEDLTQNVLRRAGFVKNGVIEEKIEPEENYKEEYSESGMPYRDPAGTAKNK